MALNPKMLSPRLRSRSRSAVPLAAALLIGLTQMPLRAAERVSFRFGELERSVRVADLADFVNQGVITEEDRFILASLNPSDRHALRFAMRIALRAKPYQHSRQL